MIFSGDGRVRCTRYYVRRVLLRRKNIGRMPGVVSVELCQRNFELKHSPKKFAKEVPPAWRTNNDLAHKICYNFQRKAWKWWWRSLHQMRSFTIVNHRLSSILCSVLHQWNLLGKPASSNKELLR